MAVWRLPEAPFTCIQPIPLSCALRNSAFGLQVRVISRQYLSLSLSTVLEPQLEANTKTKTRKNSLEGFITSADLIALKIHSLHSRIASKQSLLDDNTCTVQHNHTADLNI